MEHLKKETEHTSDIDIKTQIEELEKHHLIIADWQL